MKNKDGIPLISGCHLCFQFLAVGEKEPPIGTS